METWVKVTQSIAFHISILFSLCISSLPHISFVKHQISFSNYKIYHFFFFFSFFFHFSFFIFYLSCILVFAPLSFSPFLSFFSNSDLWIFQNNIIISILCARLPSSPQLLSSPLPQLFLRPPPHLQNHHCNSFPTVFEKAPNTWTQTLTTWTIIMTTWTLTVTLTLIMIIWTLTLTILSLLENHDYVVSNCNHQLNETPNHERETNLSL